MTRLQLMLAITVCASALAGCELKLQWHDATDRHRGGNELQTDASACANQVGVDPNVGISPEYKKVWEDCMRSKGWAPNGKDS